MKTTKQRSLTLGAVLLTGALLQACSTAPPRGTSTNTYSGDEAGNAEQFIGDRDLAAKFVLLNLRTEPGDHLRVQFDLQNTTTADLQIEWAINWMDQNGFRIDTNPNWRPAIVSGKGFHAIQAVAPTPDAKAFKLALRKPTAIR